MGWKQWTAGTFGIVAIAFSPTVSAQLPSSPPDPALPISTQAADLAQTSAPTAPTTPQTTSLIVPARAGAGYNTSSGGYEGFGSFQGFIPLYQTPGKDLVYLLGRLLLDNDAHLGGNLVFGYRVYNPAANRIVGVYLSYDNRDTGSNVFSQLGVGFETLGDVWDARLNAYIPLGDPRQTVRESVFTTGSQVNSLQFQNNFLLVSGTRFQQTIRDVEALVAGFDGEVGARLLRFSNGGDLRGYAGFYYLAAGDTSFGVRGRLEARPLDNLTLGLGVQHDGIFGTNVFASVALSFPGSRSRVTGNNSVLARMGEDPVRVNAIAIDRQQEIKNTSSTFNSFLTNPATGQPYVFQHVTLGSTGGNGTFENPFGTVQSALNATQSDGNAIVYVQAGSNPGIPAFTIPDRVQVLSTGVAQPLTASLNGQVLPGFQIPLSGTGTLPSVTGTVTMRSDTVLSGFNITSASGPGVTFTNVNGVEIRDNVIRNTGDAGILGNGATTVNLFRNQITATRNQGIFVQNVGTATVTDNVIANTIAGTTNLANPITGDISIPNPLGGTITIPNPGSIIPLPSGQGIVITNTRAGASILRNTISNTATQGIVVLNPAGTVAIADNSITNTVGADASIPLTAPLTGTITVPTGQGIVVSGLNNTTLDISRNTITNTRGQGVVLGGGTGTVNIANNSLSRNLDQGMSLAAIAGTTTIANNRITDTGSRTITGINITVPLIGTVPANFSTGQGLILAGVTGTVNITNNTIERIAGAVPANTLPIPPSGQGIAIANSAGQVTFNLTSNQIRNTFNDGILTAFGGSGANAVNANLTIANNTLDTIGGAAPIRGDGIAIGLEQDAVVSNLLIENNRIQNTGDEAIDLRVGLNSASLLLPATARLTGTIRNNQITNPAQHGIELQAYVNTQANLTIENNTITRTITGFPTIRLESFNGGQISAVVRLNTLNNTTGNTGVLAQTNTQFSLPTSFTGQRLCVNLSNNTSPTGYQLNSFTGLPPFLPAVTIQEVSGNTNSGTITRNVPTTPVTVCP